MDRLTPSTPNRPHAPSGGRPELPNEAVHRPFRSSRLADTTSVALVALSYYAGTKIGFTFKPGGLPIAMFWPPNAILLAAFLLAPVRLWWAFLLALVPAHFLAQLPTGVPIVTAAGWFVGNAGEALLGATLISAHRKPHAVFDSLHGVNRFLLFGFVIAPLVTSFIDAAIVVGTRWGEHYWVLWTARLLSNMLAQLTIVPTIVWLGTRTPSPLVWLTEQSRRQLAEPVLLGAAVVLSSWFVFRTDAVTRASVPALIYLPLPLLLWAAVRFGPAGVSTSLLTIAIVSIESVMRGHGPFISSSIDASVLSMQVYLCVTGVPLLLLAAVIAEQRRTEASLRETSRKLIAAQERERQRIAQALNDGIGQSLTLAEIELDLLIDRDPNHLSDEGLNRLRDQMTVLSQATWEISHGLYPSNLEYLGLVHALTRLCANLRRETALQIHCETRGIPEHLPADVSLCLYRVAQEALQNIVRHSHARSATLRLRVHDGRLFLQIVDDGIGFNQGMVAPGVGFASIHERLKAVKGGVEIESAPGQGTRLDAWVALQN